MSNNIILVGPMGAGKTTLGKRLARQLKRPFIDVDEQIQERLGVSIQLIFDTEGESRFRQRELKILLDILQTQQNAVIATGGGCVKTSRCRQAIMQQRLVVHVDVGLKQQCERLRCDKKRPILQGEGELIDKLKALRLERHPLYCLVSDMRVLTDRNSFRKMIFLINQKLI